MSSDYLSPSFLRLVSHRLLRQGDLAGYIRECMTSLESYRERSNHKCESAMFREIVRFTYRIGNFNDCMVYCKEWLARIPPLAPHDEAGQFLASHYLSKCLCHDGELESAKELGLSALKASQQFGDENFVIQALCHFAMILAGEGKMDDAILELEKARTEFLPSILLHPHLDTSLARLYRMDGRTDDALKSIETGIAALKTRKANGIAANAFIEKAKIILEGRNYGLYSDAFNAINVAQAIISDADWRNQEITRIRNQIPQR